MTDAELDAIGAAVPAGRGYTMRRDRAIAEAVREKTIEECAKAGKVAASCPPNGHCEDIRCDRGCRIGRRVDEAIAALKGKP